jgi:hypothetical protein
MVVVAMALGSILGAGNTLFLPAGKFYWIAGFINFTRAVNRAPKCTTLQQLPVMRWVVVQHCHVNMAPGSNLGASTVFFGALRLFWCQFLYFLPFPQFLPFAHLQPLCALPALLPLPALGANLFTSRALCDHGAHLGNRRKGPTYGRPRPCIYWV